MDQTRHRALPVPSALERQAIAPHRGDVTTVQAALRLRTRVAAAGGPVRLSTRDSPDRGVASWERAEDRFGSGGPAPSGSAEPAAEARPPAGGAATPSAVDGASPGLGI